MQPIPVSLALLSTGEVIPLDYSPAHIMEARAALENLLAIS